MAIPWSSDLQGQCLRHPDHHPSVGVCSFCLKERLTQLSNCKTSSYSSTSMSAPYSCYSSSCNSSSSSLKIIPREETMVQTMSSVDSQLASTALEGPVPKLWPLQRSSSVACEVKRVVAASEKEKEKMTEKKKKKKGGGWWWMVPKGRRREEFRGSSWRFWQTKVVKDIIFLGVP